MTTVMGPGAVNKEKFTPWSMQQKGYVNQHGGNARFEYSKGTAHSGARESGTQPNPHLLSLPSRLSAPCRHLHPPSTSFAAAATRRRAPATPSIPKLPDGGNAR
ncbi:LOW QUALITY PROTEIN: hypothetical protein PHMEG_00023340 [Phytophthora megakarya]|uniref:Uncharacterized protein n=1 Tax=Phytophthora megakarya TaxID=4795 RepID=A0A225VHB8_9STRA|nr:LOW QUALITY PROTEIN: hypothetical protein PHMEG_00023340 [Phytophthora megakarya]